MKNWYSFLGCLLLAAAIWLIHNLSRMNSDVVSVQLIAESNIEGRARRANEPVTVTARCKASGFRLIYLHSRERTAVVRFDAEDFQHREGDFFSIQSSQLYKYVPAIFGPIQAVESFISESLLFRFSSENSKKVPVTAVSSLGFKAQYTKMSELELNPDSVLVYGTPEMLKTVDAVYTEPIIKNEIRNDVHGEARLEKPSGLRLSHDVVDYSLKVSRYVEIRRSLPVEVRNLPPTARVLTFPALIDVSMRCVFPLLSDDPGDGLELYVDYSEFRKSLAGKCVVRYDSLPAGVISCSLHPEVCECVER